MKRLVATAQKPSCRMAAVIWPSRGVCNQMLAGTARRARAIVYVAAIKRINLNISDSSRFGVAVAKRGRRWRVACADASVQR